MQQEAVQQVHAGAKWLKTMIHLNSTAAKQQLVNLVDLVAVGLEHDQFRIAVTEVANELAERLARKSTRPNSSHTVKSYAVFCLKKEKGLWIVKLCNKGRR